jgi:hypothetical protein
MTRHPSREESSTPVCLNDDGWPADQTLASTGDGVVHSMIVGLFRRSIPLIALCIVPACGDTPSDLNTNSWLMYFGDHPLKGRWGIHAEAQLRRSDLGLRWQQLLVRSGINYQLNRYTTLTLGYGFINSYPYGDAPAIAGFPENRIYQQVWVRHAVGWLKLQHRARLEQRFVRVPVPEPQSPNDWAFRQRFRYMLRADIPLPVSKRFYIGLYDEFFLNFGSHRGPRYFDQNRAYGALGMRLGKFEKFEIGYLHQYIPKPTIAEHNHTLQVALFSSRPLSKSAGQ